MHHLKTILLISSFVMPLALSLTILFINDKQIAKRTMAIMLLNTGIAFLFNYLYFEKHLIVYSLVHSLHIATVLWLFPSVYIYLTALTQSPGDFRQSLRHLIPGAVAGCISAILFYGLLDYNSRIYYLQTYRTDIVFDDWRLITVYIFRLADVLLIAFQCVYYSIKLIRFPKCYQQKLLNEFSNIDKFSVKWIQWFNGGFVTVGLFCIIFYLINPAAQSNELFLVVFLFVISSFIWMLGVLSFRQSAINIPPTPLPCGNNIEQLFDVQNDDPLLAKLIDLMDNKQLYLKPNLTLTTLSAEIGTNRSYLSAIINQHYGMNFNAFINYHRAQWATQHLKQYPTLSREALCQLAGFGSTVTMKRALMAMDKSSQSQPKK